MRHSSILSLSTGALVVASGFALAQQATFDINRISDKGVGEKLGIASVTESKKGAFPSRSR